MAEWSITFDSLERVPQNIATLARLDKWTPEMKNGVVLWGSVGTGKSTVCKAVINKFASKTYTCKFVSVTDALKAIRGSIGKTDTSIELECAKLINPNLLVFDDLGVDNASDWAKEQIFSIFEARSRAKKHTWFTTNLDPDKIEEIYGSRIHERMLEHCTFVAMSGDSFRKMKYKAEI
jgi:DNA replication protein DnaC